MMAWLVMERGVCNLLDLMLNTGGLLKKESTCSYKTAL